MEINVTQEHIDNGAGDSYSCPLALAIQDSVPKAHRVSVLPEEDKGQVPNSVVAFLALSGERLMCLCPTRADAERALDFIFDFDDQKPVEPTTFHFEEV